MAAPSIPLARAIFPRALLWAFVAALSSCASQPPSVCDPATIEQGGRCFWSKQEACDAASCIAPSECELVEGKPAHVVCHKPE